MCRVAQFRRAVFVANFLERVARKALAKKVVLANENDVGLPQLGIVLSAQKVVAVNKRLVVPGPRKSLGPSSTR